MAKSKYIALVSLLSAFSGVLQATIAPLAFAIIKFPLVHDLLVFFPLLLSVWIFRRFGGAIGVGIVSSLVALFFGANALLVLGFVLASFVFDVLMFLVQHNVAFNIGNILVVSLITVLSAYFAGFIIGIFFMGGSIQWSLSVWAPLHAVGGAISLILSYPILVALDKTGVRRNSGF